MNILDQRLFERDNYTIRDLSRIVKKQTQTIRSWETKGIIQKPKKKSSNGWREYSKETLAQTLEDILNYNWERKVIKNENEIQYIIDRLRDDNINYNNVTLIN